MAEAAYLGTLADLCGGAEGGEFAPLVETASRLLRDVQSIGRFRASRGQTALASGLGIWSDLASLGLVAACAPERCGGSALSPIAGVLLAEVFGRQLAPEPYIAGALLPPLLLSACESEPADALLRRAANGDSLPIIALQERPGVPTDDVETTVSTGQGALQLKGRKRFVHGAPWASHFIVAAKMDGRLCLAVVARERDGVRLEPRVLADGTPAAEIVFDDVRLNPAELLATDNRAPAILAQVTNWAQVAISAELFGIATALFAMTIDYLKTRKQFDQPVGSFQALQHRAADLYCHKEIARFAIAEAIMTIGSGGEVMNAVANRCKARAADTALKIARESVQLHGAIGFSDEADVGLYLRRAMALAAWMGGADAHRRAYAQAHPVVLEQ